jgi:A/G-specific adenine glycosylase
MHVSFQKSLRNWYRKSARDLPWRHTRDPYKIWISEVMLQQTTVATVIPYYKKWIRTFATVKDVARAPLQHILKAWQGLGYYGRARSIHRSAKIMCAKYGAHVPSCAQVLCGLPGFGPYTMGAVLSIAFDQRRVIIDANIRRVVMRLRATQGLAVPRGDKEIHFFLQKVLPQKGVGLFNQALMELGALVCRSKAPLCLECPLRSFCLAFRRGRSGSIPKFRKADIKKIEAVAAVIQKKGRYFIQKRAATGLLAGLWEFPGGKIEKQETLLDALRREIKEELGVSVLAAERMMTVRHAYTQFRVKLFVFRVRVKPWPGIDRDHKWAGPGELKKYPVPSAIAKIIKRMFAH